MIVLWDEDEKELINAQNRNEPINYTRKLPWENEVIECIDQTDTTHMVNSLSAEFFYISTRKKYVQCGKYRILLDKDNEILWIGRYEKEHYFIVSNNQLYALWYEHGIICIRQTACIQNDCAGKVDDAYLDEIINKYKKDMDYLMYDGEYTYTQLFFNEFMEKEFYLRGPKWQDGKYPNDITILKRIIKDTKGLLKIELENSTYPFDAYVLFDIASLKIIDGKTSMNANTKPDKTSNEKNDDILFKKLKNILVDVFKIDESLIEMNKNLDAYSYYTMDYTGLGRGMEYFDLLFHLEECFTIKIADNDLNIIDADFKKVKTIGDLYGYIKKIADAGNILFGGIDNGKNS
jgi:acyl carrier protein